MAPNDGDRLAELPALAGVGGRLGERGAAPPLHIAPSLNRP